MTTIERSRMTDGAPETLKGYVFSMENMAHTFLIHHPAEYDEEMQENVPTDVYVNIKAYFVRADGVTVTLDGSSVGDGDASVTLTRACYQVPGRFTLSIFTRPSGGRIECIYACTGEVFRSSTPILVDNDGLLTDVEALRQEILSAHLMAVFAQNIGDVEAAIASLNARVTALEGGSAT